MTTEFVICCDVCQRPIGPMSQDEMDYLLSCHEDGSPVICFDCDPDEASTVFSNTSLTRKLYCHSCLILMAEVTEEEYEAVMLAEGEYGECFLCDPDEACAVPGFFEDLEPGEVVGMGDMVFVACDTSPVTLVNTGFSHTRGNARAHAVYLVSTYLNTSSQNPRAYLDRVRDEMICVECGQGVSRRLKDGWHCDLCGWFEAQVSCLVLPDWIIKPGEGFRAKPNSNDCPDCAAVRELREGSGLCDYHHTLLIEQYEDGSLGWDNV